MRKIDFARTSPSPLPVVTAGPTHRTTTELKLRKGAGRHYATQYILAGNSHVFLLRISGLWASVQHGETFGWLPAQCLERLITEPVAPPVAAPGPKRAQAPGRNFIQRVSTEPADEVFHPTHRSTADLNLRKGSGTSYPVLHVLPAQALIRKLDEAGTWTKISTGKMTGWVPGAYLVKVNIKRPAIGIQTLEPTEYTTTVRLNVRKGTGDQYAVMRILQAGTLVRVNGSVGEWRRVAIGHEHGWVPASQLTPRHLEPRAPMTAVATTLYQGASKNFRPLSSLDAGEELVLLANLGLWTKVRFGTLVGWVNSTHLR